MAMAYHQVRLRTSASLSARSPHRWPRAI